MCHAGEGYFVPNNLGVVWNPGFGFHAVEFYREEKLLLQEKIQNKETWELGLASVCRDVRGLPFAENERS